MRRPSWVELTAALVLVGGCGPYPSGRGPPTGSMPVACTIDRGCEDGDACTSDLCDASGTCTHADTSDRCDDGDPRTADRCDPVAGCVSESHPRCRTDEDCDDGNLCTSDLCYGDGACAHAHTGDRCDDGDPRTVDRCEPDRGCVNERPAVTRTETFKYTGAVQTFVVPEDVLSIVVDAYGAQGGAGDDRFRAYGGKGGHARARIAVTPGERLDIHVGGAGFTTDDAAAGGYNGGGGVRKVQGFARGGTGGGASDVRRGPDLRDRLIVAAGGGGGGWSRKDAWGGAGGGLEGQPGNNSFDEKAPGGGATQTAGGSAGWIDDDYPNEPGTFGRGGTCFHDDAGCGGGGGGWYGGGTGGFAGGGGGSSYVRAGSTEAFTEPGVRSGNGAVTITFEVEE